MSTQLQRSHKITLNTSPSLGNSLHLTHRLRIIRFRNDFSSDRTSWLTVATCSWNNFAAFQNFFFIRLIEGVTGVRAPWGGGERRQKRARWIMNTNLSGAQ